MVTRGYNGQLPIDSALRLKRAFCHTSSLGDRATLMGATGSGKSTLLKNLIGLKQLQTLAQVCRQIGFSFQDANDQIFMPRLGRVTQRASLLSSGRIQIDSNIQPLLQDGATLDQLGLPMGW